jgi:hypothetical protein
MSNIKKIKKNIKQNINTIKEKIFFELFESNFQFSDDTSNDINSENIYNEFELEITKWLIENYMNKDKFDGFGDYLNNKYLASSLDKYGTSRKVKEYRKIIISLIDLFFVKKELD